MLPAKVQSKARNKVHASDDLYAAVCVVVGIPSNGNPGREIVHLVACDP